MSDGRWHVRFVGGQRIKWALDEDLRWAVEALGERVRSASPIRARMVCSVWWPALLGRRALLLPGQAVVCFADNPPAFYLTEPRFAEVVDRVDLWIARSREAEGQFRALGLPVVSAPYCVDEGVFRPVDPTGLRSRFGVPDGAFVIGNFFRDTEGSDLRGPKAQKGPDRFLEIVRNLRGRLANVHVLLAGPRRHWLRENLRSSGIEVTFVGEEREGDDYAVNILPRETLNLLYNVLDVCLIPSRWEGGPHAVLEAALAGCPILSAPVGIARDILPEAGLFGSCEEAVEKLQCLALARGGTTEAVRDVVRSEWSLPVLRRALYDAFRPFPVGRATLRDGFGGRRRGGHRERIVRFQERVRADLAEGPVWSDPRGEDVIVCARAIWEARCGR